MIHAALWIGLGLTQALAQEPTAGDGVAPATAPTEDTPVSIEPTALAPTPPDAAPAVDPGPLEDAAVAGPVLAPEVPGDVLADPAGKPPSKFVWGGIAVPLVNYNTTDGLGFGAGFQIFDRKRGLEHGYQDLLTFDTFWTTRGTYTSNFLQYERRGKQMIVARIAYRMWSDMLYVGHGGAQVSVRDDPKESAGNFVAGPSLLANAILPIPNTPVQVWAQAYVRQTTVRAKVGGLLDKEQPYGVHGGWNFDFSAGVAIQETDRWPMAQRGVRFEASVRGGATAVDGKLSPIVGTNVELMGWWPVAGEWLVIGGRTLFDKTWGERPFFEGEWLGGQYRDESAYEQMLTGYGRSRPRGDGVFATMFEIRPKLGHVSHPFWDLGFYLSLFAETGFLFDGDKPGPQMPSVGVAPDLLWQGAIELRPFLSWGWMSDTLGGQRTPDMQVGISLLGPL